MTSEIFKKWLLSLSSELQKKNRKILLLLDNCSSHKIPFAIKNIELLYLPKNTTSILQPLDAGIIKSFKSKYLKYQIGKIISEIDNCNTVEEIYKNINIKDAIIYSSWAWRDVSENCIFNCWCNTGLIQNKNQGEQENIECENLNEMIKELKLVDPIDSEILLNDFDIEDAISLQEADDYIEMKEQIVDEELKLCESSEECDEENSNIKNINISQAYDIFEQLKNFIFNQSDAFNISNSIKEIENFLHKKKRDGSRKTKITDFLIKK